MGEKNTPERHAKGEGVKKFVPTNGPSSSDPLESDDSSKLWRIFFFEDFGRRVSGPENHLRLGSLSH